VLPVAQIFPQPPQFNGSSDDQPQYPAAAEPHASASGGQVRPVVPAARHWPDLHALPAAQTIPQPPQLIGSSLKWVQLPLQRLLPNGHCAGGPASVLRVTH
jgi:hypothetical protein